MRMVFTAVFCLCLFSAAGKAAERIPRSIPRRWYSASKHAAVCHLVVTGYFANGETRDLTRNATFTPSAAVVEVRDGVALPKKDGRAEISVVVGRHSASKCQWT